MPRTVKGPDGVTHVFPNDATDEEISAALDAAQAKNPDERSWTDTAVDALPAVGGALGGIVGGVGGTAFGLGVGGVPGAVGGAALGGGAGEAARQLVNRVRGKPAPVTEQEAAAAIAKQAGIQGAAQGVGEVAGPLLSATGSRLMQSAAKPTLATLNTYSTTAPRLVKTLLDEGVNVTPEGLAKLNKVLGASRDELNTLLSQAPGDINPLRVASRLSDTARKFANQVNPTSDLEAISKAGEEFLEHPALAAKGTLSVPEAQALKTGTYQQLAGKYGELSSASTEAQKSLARGLKEEIETLVPGAKDKNAYQSALMAARDAVSRRVTVAGNRDPVGIAWLSLAAHNPTVFLANLMDRSPVVKSMIARGMYQAAGSVAKVSPQLIRLAVVGVASGDEPGAEPGQD